MTDLHLGDELTVLRFTVKENGAIVPLSSGSALLKLKKKKEVIIREMEFYTDGTDGILQYVTKTGDIEGDKGKWTAQIELVLPGVWHGHSSKAEVEVDDNVDT